MVSHTSYNLTCNVLYCLVTLFEAMVVNNWWIIMEGFQAHNNKSRTFFIIFHLTTYVSLMLNIIASRMVLIWCIVLPLYRNSLYHISP